MTERGMPEAEAGGAVGLRGPLVRGAEALRMAWRGSPGMAAAWIGSMALISGLPILVAWVGKALVDAALARLTERALLWVAVELLLVATLGALQRCSSVLRSLMGLRLGLTLHLELLQKAQAMELLQFQDPVFYDQLTRARREVSQRPLAVAGELLGLLGSVGTLSGFILLLLSFSPGAVLLLLVAAVPAALVELRFSKATFDLRNQRASDVRLLGYLEHVLASDEHAKEVMMLGLGPVFLERYRSVGERLWVEERGLAIRRNFWVILLGQLGTLSFYGCYAYVVVLTATGRLGLGAMTMYAFAFRQGQIAFQTILLSLGSLYEHDLYMSNLLRFLSLPTGKEPMLLGAAPVRDERGPPLRGRGVSLSRPGGLRPAPP
jgi:ATP-binding cassette subfamily B protein